MTKIKSNKILVFLLIILSSSILTIDKEKKWLFGGIATFLTYNFLAYKYEKRRMEKERQNTQAEIAEKQNFAQEIGVKLGAGINPLTSYQLEDLEAKQKYMEEHPTRYLLERLTFPGGLAVFGGLWMWPNLLGITFYCILKDINIKNN